MENNVQNSKRVIFGIIDTINNNKDYLTKLDSGFGDGDHGINMSKGMDLAKEALNKKSFNLSEGFSVLSDILLNRIGGSMGPIYGYLFTGFADSVRNMPFIDYISFVKMLENGLKELRKITSAQVGDKTVIDVLEPVVAKAWGIKNNSDNKSFELLCEQIRVYTEKTKEIPAKVGRAARLGEQTIGHLDVGSVSCSLILISMIHTIMEINNENNSK